MGIALNLRYLVTDLLLMQTKLAKIRSSATLPLLSQELSKFREHKSTYSALSVSCRQTLST